MALAIVRGVFVFVAIGVAFSMFNADFLPNDPPWTPWVALILVLGLAGIVIFLDIFIPQKRLEMITALYFGLIIGLFLTYVVSIAIAPLFPIPNDAQHETLINQYKGSATLVVGMVICYLCVSVLMQTKDDFRFIIPYVEFAKEVKGLKPYILDTSVVIDGRIADVVETGILDNQLIMPRFVLAELQSIADSSDKLRRSRGRRGLDILNRLRTNPDVDLKMYERESPDMASQPVDMKLVLLAKHMEGKLVTGDYNLNKVARVQNVQVLNLNDLANALKPQFLPGEQVQVKIVKMGEEEGQGVGYLDDGTMIVVEGGKKHVGKQVEIAVTSVLQTSAGRMIFGRCG